MKTEHYPSLELCKKLTEIRFPETTEFIINANGVIKEFSTVEVQYRGHYYDKIVRITREGEYLCPSVMEMLDVIPEVIQIEQAGANWGSPYTKQNHWFRIGKNYCEYYSDRNDRKSFSAESTPNALAEMVVFLVENGHIKFTK